MPKVLKQFYLEPEQVRQIEQLAERESIPQAEVVRRALTQYLKTNEAK